MQEEELPKARIPVSSLQKRKEGDNTLLRPVVMYSLLKHIYPISHPSNSDSIVPFIADFD